MLVNFLTGALIGLFSLLIIKGDTDDEREHEIGGNRPNRGSPGTKRSHDPQRNRSGTEISKQEKAARLRLKIARVQFQTARLNRQNEVAKNELILKKQSDATGSVLIDNPGNKPDRNNGEVAVTEEPETEGNTK